VCPLKKSHTPDATVVFLDSRVWKSLTTSQLNEGWIHFCNFYHCVFRYCRKQNRLPRDTGNFNKSENFGIKILKQNFNHWYFSKNLWNCYSIPCFMDITYMGRVWYNLNRQMLKFWHKWDIFCCVDLKRDELHMNFLKTKEKYRKFCNIMLTFQIKIL
jgi:hypothetical protein